jgi:alanine racemase
MQPLRTWAEIDLGALERNLGRVVRAAAPAAVMPVVKADAYGHGAVAVAWHLTRVQGAEAGDVPGLGVGDSSEALELREAGITAPILVLGAVVPGEWDALLRAGGVAITVHSTDRVRALRRAVRRTGACLDVHLKVDTGMGRLGCAPQRALGIAREIQRSPGLILAGVSTHLASTTPAGGRAARRQMTRFRRVLDRLAADGIRPRWRHAFASGATLADLPSDLDLVRVGLALYGIDPHGQATSDLEPVLAWRTQIVFLKDHRVGARIGYGRTWRAGRPSRIATLPVGYNDGYRFAFSNRAKVLVRGRRVPVVGRVSMDYVTVDVTDVPGAAVGDVVTLLGTDGEAGVTTGELAAMADTIPYEILCGIGRRVTRRYRHAEEAVPATLVRKEVGDPR